MALKIMSFCSRSLTHLRSYGTRQESRPWKQRPNRRPRLTLILSEDVSNLGLRGEMVHVKRGYGRNFLLPKGKAVYATQENISKYNTVEKRLLVPKRGTAKVKMDQKFVGGTEFLIRFLKGKRVRVEQEDRESGWSIHESQLSTALRKQLQLHVPLDCIVLSQPITSFGSTNFQVNLDDGTTLSIPVDIVQLPEHKRKISNSEESKKEALLSSC